MKTLAPKAVPVVSPRADAGEIQQAIATIAAWSTRNDVYLETMRRAKFNLPQGPVVLLARLARSEPVRLSELASEFGVDKSTISPQVRRLEREGLISRAPDPRDRRAALLQLTRAGQAALARLHKTRAAMFDEMLTEWPERERAQAARVLTRLARQLEQFDRLGG